MRLSGNYHRRIIVLFGVDVILQQPLSDELFRLLQCALLKLTDRITTVKAQAEMATSINVRALNRVVEGCLSAEKLIDCCTHG